MRRGGGERLNRAVVVAMMEEDDSEREREEREIIQLHRLCSRSQTICVCKEQKRRNKRGEKEKNCKEGKTR